MWILDELKKMSTRKDVAIIHRERQITFEELWNKSEQLANWLDENTKSKNPIVIYGNKDIDINIIMIAVLKSGRAYVPVDIAFPKERLYQIIEMVQCEVVFNLSEVELDQKYKTIEKSGLVDIFDKYANIFVETKWVQHKDVCYILFTSGSTGVPKGVQISKKNIENFTDWFDGYCNNGERMVLNQISYSFDVSVIPLYIYLAQGKTLFNIDYEMLSDYKDLFKNIGNVPIDVWISTPAFLESCSMDINFGKKLLPELEKFILAGEVLTKKLVNTIHTKFAGSVIINGYGPTEGTVLLSACEITDEMVQDTENNLPIGYAIPEGL